MKKKITLLLLMLVMLFAMASNVSAANYSGTCGKKLKWTLDTESKVLRITGTGTMLDYAQGNEPWHIYKDQYTKVIVEEGCTRIGNWAFGFSENLKEVVLPKSVTAIGDHAFAYCGKLVECPLPKNLEAIENWAFYDCRNLTGMTFPKTMTHIGEWAFNNCKSLTSVNIPGSVTSLPYGAFNGCSKLTNLTISEGVETIGGAVFRETGVITVTFPDSMITIGESSFKNCDSLEVVTMLGGKVVGDSAFEGCEKLRKVTLAPNTERLDMYAFAYCNSLVSLRLPASLTTVAHGALYWHKTSGYPSLAQVVVMNPECDINYYSGMGQPGVCTIYGYEDSTAQDYAISRGYNFDLIGNEAPEPSIFSDVPNNAFYSEPVEWAVQNQITSGMSPTTFVPDAGCTRGQVVTFLWRAAGCPAPKNTNNPFKDVSKESYYADAVLWAVEKGITLGTGADTFSPNDTCTRGQIVTFLYRAEGSPKVQTGSTNPFADVQKNDWFLSSVLWAVKE